MVSSELITGESLPMHKKPGDELPAGALNLDGSLVIKATQAAEHSTPARITRLAQEAQVGLQSIASRFPPAPNPCTNPPDIVASASIDSHWHRVEALSCSRARAAKNC